MFQALYNRKTESLNGVWKYRIEPVQFVEPNYSSENLFNLLPETASLHFQVSSFFPSTRMVRI